MSQQHPAPGGASSAPIMGVIAARSKRDRRRRLETEYSRGARREDRAQGYWPISTHALGTRQCASVVVAVHVLVPFVPQMFRSFVDMTLRATRGALRALVPAMFGAFVPLMRETLGAFPIVVRIVQIIVRVGVLPPCKP